MTTTELPQTQQLDTWHDELLRSPNFLGKVTKGTGVTAVCASVEAAIESRLPEAALRAQGKMALGPLELI